MVQYTSSMLKYSAFFVLSYVCFAQLDSNSVTVSASRDSTLAADQVILGVYADTALTGSMADAIAVLQGAGITAANFSSVSTTPMYNGSEPTQTLTWAFGLGVSLSKMKETITTLVGIQQAAAQKGSLPKVTFSVQGMRVSPESQQTQTCSIADLLSDARAQAQKLADATQMTLGPVLAMSSNVSTSVPNVVPVISPYYYSSSSSSYPTPCYLSVKFGLTR